MQQRSLFSTDDDHDWHLDDRTRALGRSGVAQARAILQRSPSTPLGRAA